MKIISFSILVLVISCSNVKSGTDVLTLMKSKYANNWYTTLTFRQSTTWYKQNGEIAREQTWLEALSMPGQLVIKFDSISSGDGILFKNDKMSQFKDGKLVGSGERLHELLILGFDVYFDNVDVTNEKLKKLNFNTDFVYSDVKEGKEVYVVGQNQNTDSVMNHFVIDKENLIFLYLIKKNPNNTISKTVFTDYEKFEKGWVGKQVDFYINDKLFLKEIYHDVKINVDLDPTIFSESDFTSHVW